MVTIIQSKRHFNEILLKQIKTKMVTQKTLPRTYCHAYELLDNLPSY